MVTIRSSAGTNADSTFSVVVLPEPVPPPITMFSRPSTQTRSRSATWGVMRAETDEVADRERLGGELADRQQRAVQRHRRHDRVDPAAVGQPGVHHGAGLVHPPADPGHDLVDGAAQVALVGEGRVHRVQQAVALDVDLVVAVDHDLGYVRVAQVRLQRPVAEDVVRHLLRDAHPVGRGHRASRRAAAPPAASGHPLFQLVLVDVRVVELRPERLQQRLVHAALHRAERVGVAGRAAGRGRDVRAAARPATRSCESRSDRLMPTRPLLRDLRADLRVRLGLRPPAAPARTWRRPG